MVQNLVLRVVASAVVFGTIALFGLLVGRGGGQERAADGVRMLGYSAFIRGMGVLFAVVIPIVLIWAFGWVVPVNGPNEVLCFIGMMFAFGLIGVALLLEGFRTTVLLTRGGIGKFHWWCRPRFVGWAEVERIDFRTTQGEYAVHTHDGRTLTVPGPMFFGPTEWFQEACRTHLRPDQYPATFHTPTS